jgi:hypothetical protein
MEKVIYKQYVKKPKLFRNNSERAYFNFLLELKKLYESGRRNISTDSLHFYIRRHSYFLIKNNIKNFWNEKARRYYFMFWIRRAQSAGFIRQDRLGLGWTLTEKLLKLREEV